MKKQKIAGSCFFAFAATPFVSEAYMHGVHFPVNWQITWAGITARYSSLFHYAMCVALMGLVGGMLLNVSGARKLMIAAGIMWGTWLVCNRNGRKYYYAVCKLRYPCRLCLRIWL